MGAPGHTPAGELVQAVVDTGADSTVVPIQLIRRLNAPKVDQAVMRSQWGEQRPVSIYALSVQIGPHSFAAMWVIGDDQGEEIILGRNLLNRLKVILDGPAGMLEVADD